MDSELPEPLDYFPLDGEEYKFQVSMRHLEEGSREDQVFQFDNLFCKYRMAKVEAREDLEKHHTTQDYHARIASPVARTLVTKMTEEHPVLFKLSNGSLECKLTEEVLHFDDDMRLITEEVPRYDSSLDALASQLQEDLAVVSSNGEGNYLSAVHVSFPNHWKPDEAIGNDFMQLHDPVPEASEYDSEKARAMMRGLTRKGPYEHFIWGLVADDTLDKYPDTERNSSFDPSDPSAYLRVERQATVPVPEADSFIFTIRTYFSDVEELSPERLEMLSDTLEKTSEEMLDYKGITPEMCTWIGMIAES